MRKINVADLPEEAWYSPKGKFGQTDRLISEALGRQPFSTNLQERHPFDLEICRVPAEFKNCPYHSHSLQWEFYMVISGAGMVRHEGGETPVGPGDSLIFAPGEAHQLIAAPDQDLVVYIVADNPMGESTHYPDSQKWSVRSPEKRLLRSENLDYFDGEEWNPLRLSGCRDDSSKNRGKVLTPRGIFGVLDKRPNSIARAIKQIATINVVSRTDQNCD